MLNFETHIESRFHDPKILLCLLFQHCDRKIRNRIQDFSDKDISGYRMARDRLEQEFDQPCITAEACKQRLKDFSAVKSEPLEKNSHPSRRHSLLRQHKLTGHHDPSD